MTALPNQYHPDPSPPLPFPSLPFHCPDTHLSSCLNTYPFHSPLIHPFVTPIFLSIIFITLIPTSILIIIPTPSSILFSPFPHPNSSPLPTPPTVTGLLSAANGAEIAPSRVLELKKEEESFVFENVKGTACLVNLLPDTRIV